MQRLQASLGFGAMVGLGVYLWHLVFAAVGLVALWLSNRFDKDLAWGLQVTLVTIGFIGGSIFRWLWGSRRSGSSQMTRPETLPFDRRSQ
jgi:predicted permease